ncbi:MAG TPA: hypothetical protein VGG44_03795 [Tepidisphaeraceae bacterium]|jgi:hypothetical protein
MDDWNPLAEESIDKKRLDRISVGDSELTIGDRVRLRPLGRSDIFDIALDGKIATIVSIEQDYEDRIHVAVTVDDDPGNDFGLTGQPGHRFFFGIDEVEPISLKQNG